MDPVNLLELPEDVLQRILNTAVYKEAKDGACKPQKFRVVISSTCKRFKKLLDKPETLQWCFHKVADADRFLEHFGKTQGTRLSEVKHIDFFEMGLGVDFQVISLAVHMSWQTLVSFKLTFASDGDVVCNGNTDGLWDLLRHAPQLATLEVSCIPPSYTSVDCREFRYGGAFAKLRQVTWKSVNLDPRTLSVMLSQLPVLEELIALDFVVTSFFFEPKEEKMEYLLEHLALKVLTWDHKSFMWKIKIECPSLHTASFTTTSNYSDHKDEDSNAIMLNCPNLQLLTVVGKSNMLINNRCLLKLADATIKSVLWKHVAPVFKDVRGLESLKLSEVLDLPLVGAFCTLCIDAGVKRLEVAGCEFETRRANSGWTAFEVASIERLLWVGTNIWQYCELVQMLQPQQAVPTLIEY